LPGKNTLAYDTNFEITPVKSFITLALDVEKVKGIFGVPTIV
jgi:hypothetical protein